MLNFFRKFFLLILMSLQLTKFCFASDESIRLETAEKAAYEAGEILLNYWNDTAKKLKIQTKKVKDYVTQADKDSEELIKQIIQKKFPQDAILGEESGFEGNKDAAFIWIIDGLDGTTNFIRNREEFSISIGIAKLFKDKLEYMGGIIYRPITHEFFKAWRGKGAFLNGKKISVSQESLTQYPLMMIELNEDINPTSLKYQKIKNLFPFTDVIRARTGSAVLDLARVACGQHDAFISFGLHPWDIAAGVVIIEEAGGQVLIRNWGKALTLIYPFITENVDIISSNRVLYNDLMTKMNLISEN